ncbi:MAG: hypothetical protein D4S01_03290 [Dehalococcoidia bacterium]|nr:MAG: hypothetical protein D4S01_03290 [Dehalococcoidia bacterium]
MSGLEPFAWQICTLILVIVLASIFRKPLANLIDNIGSIIIEWTTKGEKRKVQFNVGRDIFKKQVTAPSEPSPQVIQPEGIQSTEAFGQTTTIVTGISELSKEEIEGSKQKAQQRLDEDTKRAGYQRGKLNQLPDKSWGIAWEVTVNDQIVIKDDAKSDSETART